MSARQVRDEVFVGDNMVFKTTDNAVDSSEIGPPRRGKLFAVRFVDHHDRVGSRLFRRRSSAERFAAHVEARGGTAAVFWSRIGAWST